MSMTGGGMMGMGSMPDMYNLVVNTNHPLANQILQEKDDKQRKQLIAEAKDLALLSQNLLQGEALTNFVEKHFQQLKQETAPESNS